MSAWVDQIFQADQVHTGGVVRRSVYDVQRFDVLDEIVQRARANNWHVIETGDQIVILCHDGDLRLYC